MLTAADNLLLKTLASTPNTLARVPITLTPTTTEGTTCLPGQYSEHTRWRGRYIYTYNRGGHVSPLASTPNTFDGVAVTFTPTTT